MPTGRAHRLIVEVDGYKYHRTRRRFESDRRKDAALTDSGLPRHPHHGRHACATQPHAVSAQLGALLSVRRA